MSDRPLDVSSGAIRVEEVHLQIYAPVPGGVDERVEEMEGERAALSQQLSLLEGQLDVLGGEVGGLETETSALKERELTAEQEAALLERFEALTQEVEDLEGKRKALLVAWRDRHTPGVACTGSNDDLYVFTLSRDLWWTPSPKG